MSTKLHKLVSHLQHAAEQARRHQFLNALCALHDAQGMVIEGLNDALKHRELDEWGRGTTFTQSPDDEAWTKEERLGIVSMPEVEEVGSIEELAHKCGFDSAEEMHNMIASVDLTTKMRYFNHWKEHDGSKPGLQAVIDGAYIMEDRRDH